MKIWQILKKIVGGFLRVLFRKYTFVHSYYFKLNSKDGFTEKGVIFKNFFMEEELNSKDGFIEEGLNQG